MDQEIKDTVMIALSLILTAALLGFISFLFVLRGEFASAYNNNLSASQSVTTYLSFDQFNSSPLYGADVIAAIRQYYDRGIEIAVNDNGTLVYDVTQQSAIANPSLVSLSYLSSLFQPDTQYTAVLVYNDTPVSQVTPSYGSSSSVNYAPTAIVFFQQQ